MDKLKIKLDFKDPSYNRALKKAIALRTDCFEFAGEISPDVSRDNDLPADSAPDIILSESNIPLFLPVRTIISQTMAMLNCQIGPAKPLENVIFTGFCSGIGGSGQTTAALCYAGIISRIFGRKTAFCSFDPWYRQSFPESNEYDVAFISRLEDAEGFDELVMDIPFGASSDMQERQLSYFDLLDICDRRIVVMGFDEKRNKTGEKLFQLLSDSSSKYADPPLNCILRNSFDQLAECSEQPADGFDIHGALGKDVLELAKELQGE